jgi:two-component system response regulator (stage 0 sporulation protein A)
MKILLADPTEAWCDALEAQLKERYQVLRCSDGAEVIPLLMEQRPELIVLGLELPNIDGLTLLHMIRTSGIQVKILTAAYMYSEYMLRILSEFKVSHMVCKPCSVCAAMSQIYQLLHYEKERNNTKDPDPTLLALGLRMNLSGYSCLCVAIRLIREDPNQSITKILYPNVAKICGGTPERVERAIRNVIRDAWKRRDDRLWLAYFSRNRKGEILPPSNGDFITRIAFCGNDNSACG